MNRIELKTALNECHYLEYPKDLKIQPQDLDRDNCNYCGVIFIKKDNLNKTFTRFHRVHVFEYTCPFCYSKI